MRQGKPSQAVLFGTLTGASLSPIVLYVMTLAGLPLPTDPTAAASLGCAIGSLLVGAVAYFVPGGRRGEGH